MSNMRDIIVRPLVTEKTIKSQEEKNTVVFEVKKGVNKTAIKQAIEETFNVKVEKVNVVTCPTKTKRMGKYGQYHYTTKAIKKAYVKLAEGSEIKILSDK
ncbi:MAG: 50S ribosomal protein L23 [Erysipelotrichaceae bacterium]|nr:50S ribosomal protein L23 [Erysipelotrichaceae bacterium]